MKKFYNAVLENGDGKEISICFPDFPGCVSGGKTLTDALRNGRDALELHIEGMLNDGDPVPDESNGMALDEFLSEAHGERCRIAVLEVEVPDGERERINVTMPRYVLQKIDAFAESLHRTRSAFLSEAALEYIRKY